MRTRNVPITPERIREMLKRPGSFVLWDEAPEMFRTWSIGPVILTRDSGLLEQSNAHVLKEELARHPEWSEDWRIIGCSHWACGWVDHLSFRVLDDRGEPTAIAEFLEGWFAAIRDYPVASDDDYSQRTYDATIDSIAENGRSIVADNAPEDWVGMIHCWLGDKGRDSYASDDGWVPEDDIRDACRDLGIPMQEDDA